MESFFSKEMLERCIAPESEINEAIANGKKMAFSDENGKLTAYLWNGKTYVTELVITPEAFEWITKSCAASPHLRELYASPPLHS